MQYINRPYQDVSINLGVDYFHAKTKKESRKKPIIILPTGSGKSLVIAGIATQAPGKTVIFQPSIEILKQNFQKFISYGGRASVYSASAGQKRIDKTTFATIGSVINKLHLFREFDNIIIDECHLVDAEKGMYHDFIHHLEGAKVLGLTATPYRLVGAFGGAELRFLTRTRPKIFNKVLHFVQNQELFDAGYLAKLRYWSFDTFDRKMLVMNNKGTDFTEESMANYFRRIDMPREIANMSNRLLKKRKNLLVFCSLISEAERVCTMVDDSVVLTGETDKALRERILMKFCKGEIRCVINVGVLTTGFDYPELECVLIGRPTMSLALYYQMAGRVFRIHPNKDEGWIVDMGGNYNFFGKFETMMIEQAENGLHYVSNNGKILTGVPFTKN